MLLIYTHPLCLVHLSTRVPGTSAHAMTYATPTTLPHRDVYTRQPIIAAASRPPWNKNHAFKTQRDWCSIRCLQRRPPASVHAGDIVIALNGASGIPASFKTAHCGRLPAAKRSPKTCCVVRRTTPCPSTRFGCSIRTWSVKQTRSWWWQWEPQWGAAVCVCADGSARSISHSSL